MACNIANNHIVDVAADNAQGRPIGQPDLVHKANAAGKGWMMQRQEHRRIPSFGQRILQESQTVGRQRSRSLTFDQCIEPVRWM